MCCSFCFFVSCAHASLPQLGRAERSVEDYASRSCLPDLTQCPEGWNKSGSKIACYSREAALLSFASIFAWIVFFIALSLVACAGSSCTAPANYAG